MDPDIDKRIRELTERIEFLKSLRGNACLPPNEDGMVLVAINQPRDKSGVPDHVSAKRPSTVPLIAKLPRHLREWEANRSMYIRTEGMDQESIDRVLRAFSRNYICCHDPDGRLWALTKWMYNHVIDSHVAMQVRENWGSSVEYDEQRERERLDAMASLITEARGYDIHGRKK